jgi:septal ring factor EnvC (AmiA/AmiB activator)
MLLLSEVYQERITGQEIQFYKIRRLKPIFSKKKKKGKKSKAEKKLENDVAHLKNELQEIKSLLKSNVSKQTYSKSTIYDKNKTIEELRKDKLKDILTRDIHKYQDTEVSFMLSNVYAKNLSEKDKFLLKL